ncbi:MAG: AtpZ/AtpI family protein [Pseudomonadota bacterium]
MQDAGGVTDPETSDRLQALQAKIDAAKDSQAPKPSAPDPHSQAQLAWRMVIELVAGLGIGFGIGYGLDVLLGTTPWLMIIFIFLGLAAGIQTMMRSAKEVQKEREAAQAEDDSGPNGPE